MKPTLLLFVSFILFFNCIKAQNWSGIHDNKTNMYASTAVHVTHSDTILGMPNFTFCRFLGENSVCNPNINGYARLGKPLGVSFSRNTNGNEVYKTNIGGEILIKPFANLNETWILHTDTSGVQYHATVIGLDTMTILNTLDSVKKINIQAMLLANSVSSAYNTTIELSKANGFISIFSFAEFPFAANPVLLPLVSHAESKAYDVYPSRFNPGNEWMSSLIYDTVGGASFERYEHDSIISSNYNAVSDMMEVVSLRKHVFKSISPDSVISSSAMIITESKPLQQYIPEYIVYGNSMFGKTGKDVCFNGFQQIPLFDNVIIFNVQDCNGTNLESIYASGLAQDYSCFFNAADTTQPCVDVFCPLGSVDPNEAFVNSIEGFGPIDATNKQGEGFSYQYEVYYRKIDNCVSGNKFAFNFSVDADVFELKSKYVNANQIGLSWFTVNEQNVQHFEVEKSSDAIHFKKIGKMLSKGNSIDKQVYEFEDKDAFSQSNTAFYRIKMVDIDGKIQYSNSIKTAVSDFAKAIQIVIDPVSQKIHVENLDASKNYEVEILNIQGQKLQVKNNVSVLSNHIEISSLDAGIYFLILNDDLEKRSFKFSKN